MVILVFDPHVKVIIPRNKTLLLDAQNTQDHGLALLWTRDMPRASQHFYEASQPCGAAAVSLPARAQHGMLMRAHAAHRMAAPRDTHVVGRRRVAGSLGEASVRQLSGRERETGPPRFFF